MSGSDPVIAPAVSCSAIWYGRASRRPRKSRSTSTTGRVESFDITDARHGDRFTQLRKEIFGDNFPASALITVAGLARPEMLVEVQGIAVIG